MRSAIWTIIFTASVCSTSAMGADAIDFARAGITPIVPLDAFERLGHDLGMTESQAMVSAMLYRDYMTAMDGVLNDLEAQRKQDQSRLDDALSGRIRVSPDDLRALRIRLLEATVPAWEEADRWRMQLIDSVQLLSMRSPEEQRFAVGQFDLAIFCSPGNRIGLVDLSRLVPDDLPPTPALHAAVTAYQRTMGERIQADALHARAAQLADDIAAIEGDTGTRVRLQRESSDRWSDRMVVHDQFVLVVSGLVAESGKLDDGWQRSARSALFPGVWSDPSAVLAAQWVIEHGNGAQAATARRCIDQGHDRLMPVRIEAVELLREGHRAGVNLDHDAAGTVSDATNVRMQYLRNTGERSVLEQDMDRCVMADLTDGQRAAVRRAVLDRRTSG